MSKQFIVMYHSISSKENPAVVGSFPIKLDTFKKQIMIAKRLGYRFDFISNLNENINSNEKILYITGDDGTVDWSRNILPWCEENEIPTHTGVITGPFLKNKIYPLTHLIQIILEKREISKLELLSKKLKENYLNNEQLKYINKIYEYETLEYRRIIKGAFNLILDNDKAHDLIGEFSEKEIQLLENRFEKLDYYKQFKYAEIGVHTKSHCALGTDIQWYIKEEILEAKKFLIENGLTPTKYFVSPMKPRYGSTLKMIEEELKKNGFQGILDSHHGVWDRNSFIIPRIDAKNIENILLSD